MRHASSAILSKWPCRALVLALLLAGDRARAAGTMLLVEAESAVASNASGAAWSAVPVAGASGGSVLTAPPHARAEAPLLTIPIPTCGHHRVWVRYVLPQPAAPGLFAVLSDEEGEALAFHYSLPSTAVPTQRPYAPPDKPASERTGFLWEGFDVAIEQPLRATLRLGGAERQFDCVLLTSTSDPAFDPNTLDAGKLSALAAAPPPALETPAPPPGFVWSSGSPAHVDAYAGVDDPRRRFEAGLINNGSMFIDNARLVRLGFNHDHAAATEDSMRHGILTHAYVESYRAGGRDLDAAYPAPTGRFVNAEGVVGGSFSFHFAPAQAAADQALVDHVKKYLDAPGAAAISAWRTSIEDGGFFDYSTVELDAFRAWLQQKHGDIATLNKRWNTTYAGFADIVPPAEFSQCPAAWLEHRDFCGHAYVEAVARQMPLVAAQDPLQRPCVGANSSLDLLAPYFSAFRPMDFDELLSTAYGGQPHVSWDTYCADDQIACETEMMTSFADGRKPIIQEWSNHAVDGRLAARSYWSMVSKGVAGIYLFMFQDGRGHPVYPKWALLDHAGRPKPKLAAYSDAVQEVHRIEPLLTAGRYTHAVKPVAMYWSRIDLSLAKPHDSLYGTTLNSPLHVYATLRGLGYPVTWITPRQVRAGRLNEVGAVVLVGCRYMPGDVATALETWVKAGGVVIGDELPGAWNEYGQPQDTLAPIFGVSAQTPKKAVTNSAIAVQESTQGYGEVTDAAVVRKEYYTMVEEIAEQPGATHPVALALGSFMLSGIGPQPMQCIAGDVVGMTHGGHPGFVVNAYGAGKALYSSIMLGTLYESGGTAYEWDSAHAGLSFGRVLDAFLSYAGVARSCRVDGLTPYVRAKLRVESPLVTADGNAVIGLVSFNDAPTGPFDLSVSLPAKARGPFAGVYAMAGGSRALIPLTSALEEGQLKVRVPGFDTHAAILALHESPPLLALEMPDLKRGVAGLAEIDPDQTFDVVATVYAPSARGLAPGRISLTAPGGWLQSALQLDVDSVSAGGSAVCRFTLRAPPVAGALCLRPLLARYRNDETGSTPATEMIWWGAPAAP